MDDGSARRLRHAVIGAGAGALKARMPALLSPGVELVAVTDVNEEPGRSRAVMLGSNFYVDHRDMLADSLPEVCVILAPQPFHARITIDCLEASSHVLVEKPMAVRLDGADAMIEAARDAGRLLAVNLQQRFHPAVRAAKRLIEAGELGEIQRVSMKHYWTPATVPRPRPSQERSVRPARGRRHLEAALGAGGGPDRRLRAAVRGLVGGGLRRVARDRGLQRRPPDPWSPEAQPRGFVRDLVRHVPARS
jgi:predicted dehydrogenase